MSDEPSGGRECNERKRQRDDRCHDLYLQVCPHPVSGPLKSAVELLEPDLRIECGACVRNCSEGALTVKPGVGCAALMLKSWITRSPATCAHC
jgi:NAD-dependent dihydropyrimidine dehydrogenase PreA subunit